MEQALSVSNVAKEFSGVYALSGVSFDVRKGECLALVGENGAGKSTLMKILSGVWPKGTYSGDITWEGQPLNLHFPLQAKQRGIAMIHQELCLFPELTVSENLFLTEDKPYSGTPSIRLWDRMFWGDINERADELFKELGFPVDASRKIKDLSVAERQLVEIAKACHLKARLLILDEPTSALSPQEVTQLFRVLRRLKDQSVSFIYISHRLDEVFEVADRIVVLRDGKSVAELSPESSTTDLVIQQMVGRKITLERKQEPTPKIRNSTLRVEALTHEGFDGKTILENVSFELYEGEILGVAGLMGAGRSELLRSLLGVLPGNRRGAVFFKGDLARWKNVREALDSGVALLTEDRKKDGIFADLSVSFNLSITILNKFLNRLQFLKGDQEKDHCEKSISDLRVKCATPKIAIRSLSGGNQQKVLLARLLAVRPSVLLLDEPTRGVDVGAKEEIYDILRRLRKQGVSILMVSSELPEILALSDRVLVLRAGKKMALLEPPDVTQEKIMRAAARG